MYTVWELSLWNFDMVVLANLANIIFKEKKLTFYSWDTLSTVSWLSASPLQNHGRDLGIQTVKKKKNDQGSIDYIDTWKKSQIEPNKIPSQDEPLIPNLLIRVKNQTYIYLVWFSVYPILMVPISKSLLSGSECHFLFIPCIHLLVKKPANIGRHRSRVCKLLSISHNAYTACFCK